jgi:release factor glutamine methyltransferase
MCVTHQTPPDPPELTVSEEDIARIREWHERAYRASSDRRAPQSYDYLGATIVVPPGVQPITPVSHLLGESVKAHVRPGHRVLDMGTGSGVNAVLAAIGGAEVVAVDVNPTAVQAAHANAVRNKVVGRIDVRLSDVFSNVEGRFDLIVFDPPFRWFAPREPAERATTDENYQAMRTFFEHAEEYLAPHGRMLIFFGTSGDMGYLQDLMAATGFQADAIAHAEDKRDDVPVEYVTFDVQRQGS